MRSFFLLLVIIATVTCQDHGCQDTCDCPEFITLYSKLSGPVPVEEIPYLKQAGCVFSASCPDGYSSTVAALFSESGIEKPSESKYGYFNMHDQYNLSDFYTRYSMSCENGSWYANQYPNGISYWKESGGEATTSDTAWNGKKSRVVSFNCFVG